MEGAGLLLEMGDPGADSSILQDVLPRSSDEWCWTLEHPRFRVRLERLEKLVFYMRFRVVKEAFQAFGPISIDVAVNGRSLTRRRYATDEDQEIREPLPDGMIAAPGPVEIAVDVHPGWPNKDKPLGILLHSVGFRRPDQ